MQSLVAKWSDHSLPMATKTQLDLVVAVGVLQLMRSGQLEQCCRLPHAVTAAVSHGLGF